MDGLELMLPVRLADAFLLACCMESHGMMVDVRYKQGMNGNNTIHGKERMNDGTGQEGHGTIYGLEQS